VIEKIFLSDAEAPGIVIVGEQKFCSYPGYYCNEYGICEEQVDIPDDINSSHSTTSDL